MIILYLNRRYQREYELKGATHAGREGNALPLLQLTQQTTNCLTGW